MNWYEISAVVAAGAFVVLVVYLIWTLHIAKGLMQKIDVSLAHMTQTVDETARLSRQLMRAMRGLIDEVHARSSELQGVYQSVLGLGKSLQSLGEKLRRINDFIAKYVSSKSSDKMPNQNQASKGETHPPRKDPLGMSDWLQAGYECMRTMQELYRKQVSQCEQSDRNKKE